MLQLFACDPVFYACKLGREPRDFHAQDKTTRKKTTNYIKSPFSSAQRRKLVKTAQINHVTLECHEIAVLDKNSALTSRKVYRKSSLSTMLALAMMKVYR